MCNACTNDFTVIYINDIGDHARDQPENICD